MPKKTKTSKSSSSGFEFRSLEPAKSSKPSKPSRGVKRAASKEKSRPTTKKARKTEEPKKKAKKPAEPAAKKRSSKQDKVAAAKEAQRQLIRQIVPPAEDSPFVRVANLVENILQYKFEELMKSGGDALELQEAAASVGNNFILFLQQWATEQTAQLKEEHPPEIIPNPENMALRTKLAALEGLKRAFQEELEQQERLREEVRAKVAAARDAPLPSGVGSDSEFDEHLLSEHKTAMGALEELLNETSDTLEMQLDAVQQAVVKADALGTRMGALTKAVAGQARAEGFKHYEYVDKPQRLLKKMMLGSSGGAAAAAGGEGGSPPPKGAAAAAGTEDSPGGLPGGPLAAIDESD